MSPVKLPLLRGLVDSYLLYDETEGKSYDTIPPYRQKRASFFFFIKVRINVEVSVALTWSKESDKARAAGAPNGR